jgi:heme-degrading monooxygenase HmoA
MFARLTHLKFLPEHFDQIRKIYNEEVIPVIKSQKGNNKVMLLEPVDKSDNYISLTIWNTKADADAYEASGTYKKLVDKVKSLLTSEPILKTYNFEEVSEMAPSI